MGFVNWFTDKPFEFELPERATLFSISVNPCVKDRTEYLITYWIDCIENKVQDNSELDEESE